MGRNVARLRLAGILLAVVVISSITAGAAGGSAKFRSSLSAVELLTAAGPSTSGCSVIAAVSLASPSSALCLPTGIAPLRPSGREEAPDAPCVPVPSVNKCPDWTSTYDGPAGDGDGAGGDFVTGRVSATSPDGQTVYFAGGSDRDAGASSDYDYIVAAFDTATGAQRWVARYGGPTAFPQLVTRALTLSRTGSTLFVTGVAYDADISSSGIATVAFSAQTGAQLWATLFLEPSSSAEGNDVTVSPDGSRVFVTGQVWGRNPDDSPRSQAVTVAYNAATGAQVWLARYPGNPGERTLAFRAAANPDGSRVYVAGGKINAEGYNADVILLVYDPVTGAL
ncbi:MAG: PQQ-binding-like beta-propeller repeat protein, partial [Gaiellaceae bacterium]